MQKHFNSTGMLAMFLFFFTIQFLITGANVSVPLVVAANPTMDPQRALGGALERRGCGGAVRCHRPSWLCNHWRICAHWILPQYRQ